MSDDKIWILNDCIDSLTTVNEELSNLARTKKICDSIDRIVRELNDIADTYDDEEAEDNWG